MRSIKAWGLLWPWRLGAVWRRPWRRTTARPRVPAGDALGVSRVVEIDTSSGPLFGAQYKEPNFLADGEVVLTFDDGPLRAYTMPVLEALAAHCAKATFFVVGRMAVADPEMVKEYARRGHTVGTHTWSHVNLQALTPLKARAEIELGFSAVQQAMGKPLAPFFRFPFLADPKSMIIHLQERQIGIFSIDVDSKDYRTRDPGTVHRKVMADLARTEKGHHPLPRHSALDGAGAAGPAGRAEGQGLSRRAHAAEGRTPRRLPSSTARPRQELRQATGDRGGPAAGQARADLAGRRVPADGRVGQAGCRRRQDARALLRGRPSAPRTRSRRRAGLPAKQAVLENCSSTKLRIRR